MSKYICDTCLKTFSQKGHYDTHKKRKRPCKKDTTLEVLVERKVQDVLSKRVVPQQNQSVPIDYSKKTREELIAICKETKIKGYSGKKKGELLTLLTEWSTPTGVSPTQSRLPQKSSNPSPLRYPGGKTRAIPILYTQLLSNFPNRTTLLSPFFGGGSFELFLSSKGYTVYGNDLFRPLYTFWITKQQQCEPLVRRIKEGMPITKEKFHRLRNTIMDEPDGLSMASSFFLINRTSFSGATLSGGFSDQASKTRLTESSLQRLSDCTVDSIVFSNLDCTVFLEQHPETPTTVIYADPPYYIKDSIYGKDGDMHESFNHKLFAETLLKRKDWILSYNDCDYIRTLYKGCRILPTSWSYGMNKSKASSELLILPPV